MVNKNLFKCQKATIRSVKRTFYDGFYLIDHYQVKLGKRILGFGPKDKCIPLKRELNSSHHKRAYLNSCDNRSSQYDK